MKYDFSYIYPQMIESTKREASIKRLIDKELNFSSYDNAIVLPSRNLWQEGLCLGGVVTSDREFIESSAWHEGPRCNKYEFDADDIMRTYDVAIYIGFFNQCWGHSITDNLKKIWFFKTEVCKKLISEGAKLIYLTLDNLPMPPYVIRLFELAGVDYNSFVHIKQITEFKKVIIPDNSFVAENGQRYFTKEYVDVINTIKNNCLQYSIDYPSKIYFTRTHLDNCRDTGEKAIEDVFKKHHYALIAPEQHPVDLQIQYLMHCSFFAATEGSVSHNVLFCEPRTEVIIIRKCCDVNKYQMACNEIADCNATYIDAHHSTRVTKESPWGGPFFLYVNQNLNDFFGESVKLSIPLVLRLDWWKYCFYDSNVYRRTKRLFNKLNTKFRLCQIFQ